MNRKDMLNKLQEPEKVWDMVVVGGSYGFRCGG